MGPSRSNVAVVALAGLELDLQGDVMDAEYFLQHPGQRLADLFGIDLSADEHHVGGQDRLARSQSPCMQVVHSVDIGLREHLCPYVLHVQTCGNALHEHLARSEEHTSELQSLMRISYAVFCLQKKHQHKR